MADKNVDAQIAEKEAEIVKLKAEQEALRVAALPQYPKWIADPADATGASGRTVATAEEEKAVLAGYSDTLAVNKRKADLEKKIVSMREEAEKQDAKDADAKANAAEAKAKADREKGKVR